jgi:hypothetical protein
MEGERWRFAGIDEDPRHDYTTYATHAITTIAMQRDEDADTVRLYAATEPANGDTMLARTRYNQTTYSQLRPELRTQTQHLRGDY